jgi:type III pantothenate kinase
MKVDVAVDVGNTRVKWGLRGKTSGRIDRAVSLAEDPLAWQAQRQQWLDDGLLSAASPPVWLMASVRPPRSERLRRWLEEQGDRVEELRWARQLPLAVGLEKPDHVGMDRLLNAVAATRVLAAGEPAILVGAGSAVTVDCLDETHTFRGGAIFPGLRLMTEALHQYTAFLPLVEIPLPVPELPGAATPPAMQAGVFWAVIGGIDRCATRLRRLLSATEPRLFFTGGDAPFLLEALARHADAPKLHPPPTLWPEQTLEGILYSAEAMP